ncbi:MAG: IPT/TIG domain-containing protein [Bacteroidota bacterium]
MNTSSYYILGLLLALGAASGCKEDAPPSLWDPNYVSGPRPTVTSIDPSANALAGVTMLTITGTNFSAVPGNNLVFFDYLLAPVLQASTTQLQVKAPILAKDSIMVKIAVLRADLYSSPYLYRLLPATEDKFGNLSGAEETVSLECDTAGNVYASMISSGAGVGVWKFTRDGVRGGAAYSPVFSPSVASWRGMKFGPGGALFCVAGRNVIFRIPPGGGAPATWLVGSGLSSLNDLDFDQNGNIWTGGSPATSVFRVKSDKTVKAFPFVGTVRAVRVYNSYLYIGGKRDSLEKIWRFPIVADSLGAQEEYFNFSSLYGPNSFGVFALTFDTNGDMYVGTNASAGIVVVHPTGTSEEYYPGLLFASTAYLTWGNGADLFQSRTGTAEPKAMVKINTQKSSAPYYGRTLP